MNDVPPVRVRFGAFELDLQTGELRPGNTTSETENVSSLLLQEQPFRLLLMLVEREGALVAREEIQKKFWPNDTIVEFDHSINSAIGKLRKALGDSADEPNYIETVARRGYRLMVPVEWIAAAEDPPQEVGAQIASGAGAAARTKPDLGVLTDRTVSHYRVLDIIGGGGMGVVYRAEDLKLGRGVALKFLPEELASNPVALQRFEREARTASSLNHPNICIIHEVEEHEGQPFIVMELLEGETLRDRLAALHAEAIPLNRLLDITTQICDGLQAAHEKGIIHRDIKPANIFLTSSGQVKILDFGLAELMVEAPGDPFRSATCDGVEAPDFSPTNADENEKGFQPQPGLKPNPDDASGRRTEARLFHQPAAEIEATLTHTGLAMGTAGYMSPEQVRGEKLDARTDLFSFGLVLVRDGDWAAGLQRRHSGDSQRCHPEPQPSSGA